MLIKKKLNLFSVILVYLVYIVGVVLAIQINSNGTESTIMNLYNIVHWSMIILIPSAIIISIIYVAKKKSKQNWFMLILSILSISWIIVVFYVAATVLSTF